MKSKFISVQFLTLPEFYFLLLVAAYVLACWALTLATGFGADFKPLMYLNTGLQITGTFLLGYVLYRLGRAIFIMIARRPEKLALTLIEDLKKGPLRLELYTRALPIFIGFVFFFSTFTSMKILIAQIQPFAWDKFFMQADRLIHFGIDPWRILQPILGYPIITKAIAFVYVLWLPMFFMVLYWQLFRLQDEKRRMQFFYTFVLTWAINGTFAAIVFSSAGPCFYDHVLNSDYYQPLFDYLYKVNESFKIYALSTQELLWDNYNGEGRMLGGGISAFPSVHVATAFLFVLAGWHAGKWWYRGFLAFFILILIGSVHLGWHYAVDGYFAALTTWGLWWVSGKIISGLNIRGKLF